MQRTVRLPVLFTLATLCALTQQACADDTPTPAAAATSTPAASALDTSEPGTSEPQPGATTTPATGTRPDSPTPTSTRTSPPAEPRPSTPTTTTTRACRPNDLAVTFIGKGYDEQTDTMGALVTATNKSPSPCRASARIIPMLGNALGELNEIPNLSYDDPDAAATLTIKPGGKAYQAMTWHICNKDKASCAVGNWMGFHLGKAAAKKPADLVNFPAPEKNNITIGSMNVGELRRKASDASIWGE